MQQLSRKSFNSMIVRLKTRTLNESVSRIRCFNSMIVRLKFFLYSCRPRSLSFQFYDSPIKRDGLTMQQLSRKKFQFYDSPIKSFASSSTNAKTLEFQFYDSPIKSRKTSERVENCQEFQFYDSPIKTSSKILSRNSQLQVSIL